MAPAKDSAITPSPSNASRPAAQRNSANGRTSRNILELSPNHGEPLTSATAWTVPIAPNATADMAKGRRRRQGNVSISTKVRATEKACHWIVSRIRPSAIAIEPSTATSTQSTVRGPRPPGARGSLKKIRSRFCIKYALVGVKGDSIANEKNSSIGRSDDIGKVCARYAADLTGGVDVVHPPIIKTFLSLHE